MLSPKLAAELDSKWEVQKLKLKNKFLQLTNEDLAFDRTQKNAMLNGLQAKLGMTIREIQFVIDAE